MATSASQLIADDAAASRGNLADDEIIQSELEADRYQASKAARKSEDLARYEAARNKGKGKASHDFSDYHDEEVDHDSGPIYEYADQLPLRERGKGSSRHGIRRVRDEGAGRNGGGAREYWRRSAVNVGFILLWYTFSTLLSVYNKWMFSEEHYGFKYPLFVTTMHMVVQMSLASLVLAVFPAYQAPSKPTAHEYATKAAPCGMATGLDIGLSNLSLKTITLSFYTMCKSSTLAFVLLFAFIFRIERVSLRLIGIIVIITAGVVLMVSSETQFHFIGMLEVLIASALGGLRWSLTQILLDKKAMGMSNPVNTIFWLAPIMGATLGVCSMLFEGWFNVFAQEQFWGSLGSILGTVITIMFPGVLAFCMSLAEFGLIQRTSVVTLSVAGIFKEVLTIFVGATIFGDSLTPINITGLVITVFGIGLYNWHKYRQSTGYDHGHGTRSGPSIDVERDPHRREARGGLYSMVEESQVNLSEPSKFHAELHTIGEDEDSDGRSSASSIERIATKPQDAKVLAQETRALQDELKKDDELRRLDQEERELRRSLQADRSGVTSPGSSKKNESGSDDWELT